MVFNGLTNNGEVNNKLNEIWYWLQNEVQKQVDFSSAIALSGQISDALIQQNYNVVKNITFVTNDDDVMRLFRNVIHTKLKTKPRVFNMKNNVYYQFDDVLIDIYRFDGPITTIVKGTVWCQILNEIPTFLL